MARLRRFLHIYSGIFFAENALAGLVFLGVTFVNLNVGLGGFLGILSAWIFEKLTFPARRDFQPFYFYNALLVGLSIGALFTISPLTVLFIASASIFVYVLTVSMESLFTRLLGLPILSLPFAIVSSLCYLFALRNTNLFVNYLLPAHAFLQAELTVAAPIGGFFRSLGAIFFTDNLYAGLVLFLVLLFHSRIVALLGVAGYYLGALIIAWFYGAFTSTYANLNYFNFVLIAVAVGGIFNVPSPVSYLTALVAVAVSAIVLGAVEVFWASFSIPIFTLPFNLVVCLFIYYANLTGSRLRLPMILATPELGLDRHLNHRHRFPDDRIVIDLPVSGEWTVSQAFDGEYTHKGAGRFAVDLVIRDEGGREFRGAGARLEDFHCFDKPVLAPIAGTVVRVETRVEENEIGAADRDANWGNYVLLYDARGFYIKLCHLRKGSIAVVEGQQVARRQVLGMCGNTGYSPTPHLHLQVQTGPEENSPTLAFVFGQVTVGDARFVAHHEPRHGDRLAPLVPSMARRRSFALLLGESFEYERLDRAGRRTRVRLEIAMEPDGRNYVAEGRGETSVLGGDRMPQIAEDANRLYFVIVNNLFSFVDYQGARSSILADLFQALPSIPLTDLAVSWRDRLPLRAVLPPVTTNALLLFQSFHHGLVRVEAGMTAERDRRYRTRLESFVAGRRLWWREAVVELDEHRFFKRVEFSDGVELTRVEVRT
jgi:urea transporter